MFIKTKLSLKLIFGTEDCSSDRGGIRITWFEEGGGGGGCHFCYLATKEIPPKISFIYYN